MKMGSNGTRRSHVKSRHGCGQCKQRRVKCDERPPCCRNCQKRRIRCDYEDQFSATSLVPTSTVSLPEPTIKIRIHPLSAVAGALVSRNEQVTPQPKFSFNNAIERPLSPSGFSFQDMQLMHHYATVTCLTLSEDQGKQLVWQRAVPQQAQTHPWLLNNILSLAALHLAYLQPDSKEEYTFLAAKHQTKCLQGAQKRKPGVTMENCSAVIICSGLLLLHELAVLHPSYFTHVRSNCLLDEFLDKVLLMRRILVLWKFAMPLFKNGRLRQLVQHRTLDSTPSPLLHDARTALDELHTLNTTYTTDPDSRTAYTTAIDGLWACYEESLATPPDWMLTISWPFYVPDLYIELLTQDRKERQPLALVIIAHYVALLSFPANRWWTAGWPGPVLRALARAVEGPWRGGMEWPARIAKVELF